MEQKDFDGWIRVKKSVHYYGRMPSIKEGEVWWCAVGENVGVEINGKSEAFSRPVLVMKKLSRFGFLGVPLTSQFHTGNWYTEFVFKNKRQFASIAQIRVFSVSRLYKKIGTAPNSDLQLIKADFRKLYL